MENKTITAADLNKSLRKFMGGSSLISAEFTDERTNEFYEIRMQAQSGMLHDFIDCTGGKLSGKPAWQVSRSQRNSSTVGALLMQIAGLDADKAAITDPIEFFYTELPRRKALNAAQIEQISGRCRDGVFFVHGSFKTETTTKIASSCKNLLEYVSGEEYANELSVSQYSRLK